MKAPVWGMCCAVVCSAIAGIGVALHVAGQLRAADSMTVTTIGPEAPQLSRPSDGPGKLDYSNPAAWQSNGQVSRSSGGTTSSSNATPALPSVSVMTSPTQAMSNGLRQPVGGMAPGQLPSNFTGAPRQLSPAPTGTAFDPQQPAPIDGINESGILGANGNDPANQVSSRNTSLNIQTAYRQPADLRLPPANSNSPVNQPMQSGGRPAPLILRWLDKADK